MDSSGSGREQVLDHRELGLCGGIPVIQLKSLAISLAGHLCVNVTQIFMGGGIAGVGAYRRLKRALGFFVLALTGVEDCKIVVWLRQVRIIL